MDVQYMWILKEHNCSAIYILLSLRIDRRSSKEDCKKWITVAIVAESICFECNKLKRILKREEDM